MPQREAVVKTVPQAIEIARGARLLLVGRHPRYPSPRESARASTPPPSTRPLCSAHSAHSRGPQRLGSSEGIPRNKVHSPSSSADNFEHSQRIQCGTRHSARESSHAIAPARLAPGGMSSCGWLTQTCRDQQWRNRRGMRVRLRKETRVDRIDPRSVDTRPTQDCQGFPPSAARCL